MRAITLRDLEDLGFKRFEDLVAALVFAKHPAAEKLANPDGGADTLLERRRAGAKVWQAKHFPRTISWEKCINSLDAAVREHGATEIIFVFPRDMSKTVKRSFKTKLAERHAGVAVTYMSGSQVINELRQQKEQFIAEFFGPDPRTQAQAVAKHLAAEGFQVSRSQEADELSQRLQLADEAGRRDRYFRTEVAVTTGDVPTVQWTEKPALLLTSKGSDRVMRVAAWPEEGAEPTVINLWFDESEEGRQARWDVARMLARDGKATIPKGATARLDKLPEAVKALVGKSSGLSDAVMTPAQSHPVHLVGEFEGERVERTMEVVMVPPLIPWEDGDKVYEFGRMDGELSLLLCFVAAGENLAVGVRLSLELLDPAVRGGAVEALRLLAAFDAGTGRLEVPSLFPWGPIPYGRKNDEEQRAANRNALRFFESLRRIEEACPAATLRLGTEVGDEEYREVVAAADVLDAGGGSYDCKSFAGEMSVEEHEELENSEKMVVRFQLSVEVLGEDLMLGIAEAELPKPDEVEIGEGSRPSSRLVKMSWKEDLTVPFTLVSPPVALR